MRLIEEMAANAWPSLVQQQLGTWRLRAANGVTRRANSVLPLGEMPPYERWLDKVAAFYDRHNLPVRFQVSEASPPTLTTLLDGLNFTTEALTSVRTAPCHTVLERCQTPRQFQIITSDHLQSDWLEAFMRIEGFEEWKRQTYHQIMSAIAPPALFVQALNDGEPVGIGMAVSERGWAGLFNIATAVEHRRKGISTQVVSRLAEWALQSSATDLYLQVMETNRPAIAMYDRLGFTHRYHYHYRTIPDQHANESN